MLPNVVFQVVLTSTDPKELCVNGMSFSRRSSKWANAALVVTVSAKDFQTLDFHGPLAGVGFQVMNLKLSFSFERVLFLPQMSAHDEERPIRKDEGKNI